MSATRFTDHRFTMLMACASPGSAYAYHLGLATFGPALLRRSKATQGEPTQPEAASDAVGDLIASGRVLALP
jgi:hypothetical protein